MNNRLAIMVARGNEGTPTKAEDPGALKIFDYQESRRAPSIRARFTSIRVDACSWPSTIFRWT